MSSNWEISGKRNNLNSIYLWYFLCSWYTMKGSAAWCYNEKYDDDNDWDDKKYDDDNGWDDPCLYEWDDDPCIMYVGWQWKANTRQCFEETRGTRHQLLSVALSLFIGQYCSFIAFYLDVKVFRVKDNSTPETHLKKYQTLLLSLRSITKGRKSDLRPHGAIIHWSGIFEPPERNLCVLGRITQDNVFKSIVQQSSGILRTLLNCRNCTKSTEVRRTCRCRRRTNRKWGIMPPTKNLW